MVFKCSVPGCRSGYKRDGNILPIFKFPSDSTLRQQWVQNIGRVNVDGSEWEPTINHRVCAKHFRVSDFKQFPEDRHRRSVNPSNPPRKRVCLKPFAIPRIFPDRHHNVIRRSPPREQISTAPELPSEPDSNASSSALDRGTGEGVVFPGLDFCSSSSDYGREFDEGCSSHASSSRSLLRSWTQCHWSKPGRKRGPRCNQSMGISSPASLSSTGEPESSGRLGPEADQSEPGSSQSVGHVPSAIVSSH